MGSVEHWMGCGGFGMLGYWCLAGQCSLIQWRNRVTNIAPLRWWICALGGTIAGVVDSRNRLGRVGYSSGVLVSMMVYYGESCSPLI